MQSVAYAYITRNMAEWATLQFVFFAFLSCSLFYGLLSGRRSIELGRTQVKYLLLLNVWTALAFVSFYWAIAFVPGSIVSLMEAAVGPLWIIGLSLRSETIQPDKARIGVAAAVTLLAFLAAYSSGNLESVQHVYGMILAVVAGCGAALVAKYSRQSSSVRIAPAVVLAHRFHLTYLVAAGLLCFNMTWSVNSATLWITVLLGFIGVVLPLYLLQIGMSRCEPIVTMFSLTLIPLITYCFEIRFGLTVDWRTLGLIACGVCLSCAYLIFNGMRVPMTKV
jgi:hypothetical protein